jgi:urease accessory protein UreF
MSASAPDTAVAVYDWRAAARSTEDTNALEPIDHALTGTSLAAEIRHCTTRLGQLT